MLIGDLPHDTLGELLPQATRVLLRRMRVGNELMQLPQGEAQAVGEVRGRAHHKHCFFAVSSMRACE